ncbi:MAG: type II toxin-antitoxin system VapC family toxin, partial [Nitrococcus sp.]|nr:type II toxin-antitoxin system VapC family toxin [Nitrococcus sp.]
FLLLDGPFSADAHTLFERDHEWCSEGYILVELTNVLTTTMRLRDLPLAKARAVYAEAATLIQPGLVTLDHVEAMTIAHQLGITAYDARFIGAARELGTRLVTEDARLRRAAPRLTQSIEHALAN